jgi:hypothetical protein
MNTQTHKKGSVAHAYAVNSRVEIWVPSPTGDSSDSFTFTIPCLSNEQAEQIAETWRNTWNIKG